MHKRILPLLLAILMLLAGCNVAQPSSTPSPTPTAEPATATPSPTPVPLYDYGRSRIGEYVYTVTDDDFYHEIECEHVYGELNAILLADAQAQNMLPCDECKDGGKEPTVEFAYNSGFERTMQVKIKCNLTDSSGSFDILYITTGDEDFDMNNLFINTPVRLLYKELDVDPANITMYGKVGGNIYHNSLCEAATDLTSKDVFTLADAYEHKMKPCSKCSPPTKDYYTMPVDSPDHMHFYYASPKYISKILSGKAYPAPEMNIDLDRMLTDYYPIAE